MGTYNHHIAGVVSLAVSERYEVPALARAEMAGFADEALPLTPRPAHNTPSLPPSGISEFHASSASGATRIHARPGPGPGPSASSKMTSTYRAWMPWNAAGLCRSQTREILRLRSSRIGTPWSA